MLIRCLCLSIFMVLCLNTLPAMAAAENSGTVSDAPQDNPLEVIRPFVDDENEREMFTDQEKHQILFYMGAVLLLLIISTVTFGVGMVLFDKPWFVGHMVSAGLTLTLAIAHAVAAIVWFFPF